MKALTLVAAIVLSTVASLTPSNAAFVPQPPKKVAVTQTHLSKNTLTKCKKNGKKCLKPNGKFVTP